METSNTRQVTGTAVVIGKFDGVHKGHQALLDIARESAVKDGLVPIAFTFTSKCEKGNITDDSHKAQLLEEGGIGAVFVQSLSQSFKATTPDGFVDILKNDFNARHIIIGFNFRFGKDRCGDAGTMAEICAKSGVKLTVAEPVIYENEPISSTRIKSALALGEVSKATAMLGRPFSVTAKVIGGKRLGRTIGFPTANIDTTECSLLPASGVYATSVRAAGSIYPAITNIGVNPTVDSDGATKSETYIIGFEGDLYGDIITIEFSAKLRDEKTFEDIDCLADQLREDCKASKEIFEKSY